MNPLLNRTDVPLSDPRVCGRGRPTARRIDHDPRLDRDVGSVYANVRSPHAPLRRAERHDFGSVQYGRSALGGSPTFKRQSRASLVDASAYSAHDLSPSSRSEGTLARASAGETSQLRRERASIE